MMTSSRSLEDWANDSALERADEVTIEDEDEKEESTDLLDLEHSVTTWFEEGQTDRFLALAHDSKSRRSDGSLHLSSSSLGWLQSSRSSLRYPRGPRSPTKLIRFAEVIATDMIQSCSSLGHVDLLDMMEAYTVAEDEKSQSPQSSDSLLDIFGLEQQQQQAPQQQPPLGKNGPLQESQTSFTLSLENDEDENDPMHHFGDSIKRGDWTPEEGNDKEEREDDDENKKARRRVMYALGGMGVMALVGWTAKLIWQIFHRGGDEDPAGAHAHGNTGGAHHHAVLPPPDSTLLIHQDGGVSNIDQSGSISQAGFSQSSVGQPAVGVYPGGGEQAAMNPALQG